MHLQKHQASRPPPQKMKLNHQTRHRRIHLQEPDRTCMSGGCRAAAPRWTPTHQPPSPWRASWQVTNTNNDRNCRRCLCMTLLRCSFIHMRSHSHAQLCLAICVASAAFSGRCRGCTEELVPAPMILERFFFCVYLKLYLSVTPTALQPPNKYVVLHFMGLPESTTQLVVR